LSTGDAAIYGSPTRSRRSVATPPPTILSDADVDQTQRHGSLSPAAKAKIATLQARVEQLQAENGSLRYSTRHCSSVPDLHAAIAATSATGSKSGGTQQGSGAGGGGSSGGKTSGLQTGATGPTAERRATMPTGGTQVN
jgi:uncharacterized membrane protein YgcG